MISFLCNKQNCQKQYFFLKENTLIRKREFILTYHIFFIIFKLLFFYKNPFLLPCNQIKNSRAKLNLDTCQCTQFLYCQLLSFLTATRKTYIEFGYLSMYYSIPISGYGSMLLLSGAFLFWTR